MAANSFTNCGTIGRSSFVVVDLGGFDAVYKTLEPFEVVVPKQDCRS